MLNSKFRATNYVILLVLTSLGIVILYIRSHDINIVQSNISQYNFNNLTWNHSCTNIMLRIRGPMTIFYPYLFTCKIYLHIKNDISTSLLISNWYRFPRVQYLECYQNILHVIVDCIHPQYITIDFINLIGMIHWSRKFNFILMSFFSNTSVDSGNDTISIPKVIWYSKT